jgi:hypothetical protein
MYNAIHTVDPKTSLPKPDASGKIALKISETKWTIAAADELTKYLKFSTAKVLKLIPETLPIGEAMDATGTDVVWSIPSASLVTQFTGIQFQIQAETTILNQADLKKAMNPVLGLVGLSLPLLDWKINTLGMGLYFLETLKPGVSGLPGFICPQGKKGCKPKDWETGSEKLPEVGAFVIGQTSKVCSKATADFSISLLGVTADSAKDLPGAIAKWHNDQLAKAKSMFTVPDCTKKSLAGDMGGGGGAAVETSICLMQALKVENGVVSATMHPGANYNAGGFMQMMSKSIKDGSFALTVGGKSIKADASKASKNVLPKCSAADEAAAKAAGAAFACDGGAAPAPAPAPGPGPSGPPAHKHKKLSAGADAGIALGLMAFLGGLAAAIFAIRQSRAQDEDPTSGKNDIEDSLMAEEGGDEDYFGESGGK